VTRATSARLAAAERVRRAREWATERMPYADVVVDALDREHTAAAGLLAGGLAYRFFFWLVPLGLVIASALGFWIDADQAGVEDAAKEFGLGTVAAHSATEAIETGSHSRWYFLVAGSGLLVWFSISAVRSLRIALALPWGVRPAPLRNPPLAGAFFTAIAMSLLAGAIGLAWVREQVPEAGFVLTLASFLPYVAVALWVMLILPHGDATWQGLLPGAVLVAFGAQAIHLVSALYLAPKVQRSTDLYGALGSATVILLWLYLIARLLVAAAFLNASLWAQRARPPAGDAEKL
jgi:uncharacterized BrkB/YihY/UPF0761 family membrane protein